jgi:hypothetical protein
VPNGSFLFIFLGTLTKAVLTYAHLIIYDPYAKDPACLTGFHKSTISEYTWQGRCRIPFQAEYSNLATIPRHLCEACHEIGWRSPQMNPAHWLAMHELFRPHRPESMLVTSCASCDTAFAAGRITLDTDGCFHGHETCQECQGDMRVPTASGRAVLERLGFRALPPDWRTAALMRYYADLHRGQALHRPMRLSGTRSVALQE